MFGARDYSMRVWLDPARVAAHNLTAGEVMLAMRAANLQVAAGAINQAPAVSPGAFTLSVQTLGRLTTPEEFGNIVLRAETDGSVTRLRDVARVELGAQDYTLNAYLDNKNATALGIFQRPGSNAIATSNQIKATMERLKKDFPAGLDYSVVYNPTEFIQASVDAVIETLFEALILVVIVVIVFLQTWRAAIIPLLAIPVSLIGSFAVMAAVGISFNTLSLFGLVLAIGIVVDDAIVVVENVERYLHPGHVAQGGGAQDHGRGRRRADRHLPGADRGVPADRLHHRPAGHVLQAVRHHHRRLDGDLGLRVADAVAGHGGAAAQDPCAVACREAQADADRADRLAAQLVLPPVQPRLRMAGEFLWPRHGAPDPRGDHRPGRLCRPAGSHRIHAGQDADRPGPAARPLLPDRRHAASGRLDARARRQAGDARRRR